MSSYVTFHVINMFFLNFFFFFYNAESFRDCWHKLWALSTDCLYVVSCNLLLTDRQCPCIMPSRQITGKKTWRKNKKHTCTRAWQLRIRGINLTDRKCPCILSSSHTWPKTMKNKTGKTQNKEKHRNTSARAWQSTTKKITQASDGDYRRVSSFSVACIRRLLLQDTDTYVHTDITGGSIMEGEWDGPVCRTLLICVFKAGAYLSQGR